MDKNDWVDKAEQLNSIGISLSVERDTHKLLEKILLGAKRITNADAGTLYLKDETEQCLRFAIMRNDSLNIALGGTTEREITLAPVQLYDENGQPNKKTVAAYAALTGKTVNIPDAYTAEGFDFSGTKAYDTKTGYRSTSFLTIPMKNHENEIIGVLQLINATNQFTGTIIPFSPPDQRLTESLASQAAVALTNNHLISALRDLLEKFIEVIATAIDEKSPYTGGHCRRVPDIAMLLADAVNSADAGPFATHKFSDEELYELKIAALLHDCGKITTPVHIVDKATKLEAIYDRVHTVDARIEIMKRDAEINYLKSRLALLENPAAVDTQSQLELLERGYKAFITKLDGDREFIRKCNIGSEFMDDALQARIHEIGSYSFQVGGKDHPLLTEEEIHNLTVQKGTLTAEQRDVINNHIVLTQKMLKQLPFPRYLRNVPEIAGNHHERMDGKGYPNGLTREKMSVQARIMGIADIFEALTATDRPYKKAMPLSVALNIMGKMKQEGHIDPDLFDVFISERVYEKYAAKFLECGQIDPVDIEKIPGYQKVESGRKKAS